MVADPKHPEHLTVPGAEILEHDTWAEDPEPCPECGAKVTTAMNRCPVCGQWLERCAGSCPSCGSPRCVGGGRRDG